MSDPRRSSRPPMSRLLLVLLLLFLVMPDVFAAGRVLFPGSQAGSEVRSSRGGSESDFWLWRGSTRGRSERPRLLSVSSRRPHSPLGHTRPPQRLISRPPLAEHVQPAETPTESQRPAATRDHRAELARLVVGTGGDRPPATRVRPQSGPAPPAVSVPPSVILEGRGPALDGAVLVRPTAPRYGDTVSPETAAPPADPATASGAPRSRLPLEEEKEEIRNHVSLGRPVSLADTNDTGAGPDGLRVSSVIDDVTVPDRGRGGRREERRRPVLVPGGGSGGAAWPSSAEVITDSALMTSYTAMSHAGVVPEASYVNSLSVSSPDDVLQRVISQERAHTHTDTVTSQTLTIDSGSSPVYFDNDITSGSTDENTHSGISQEPRKLKPVLDDTNTGKILMAIASLKGSRTKEEDRRVNHIEVPEPGGGRLVLRSLSCPKLGGNLTLECRVEGPAGHGTVQKFRWGKRHFDLGEGLVGDQLIAVDGRPFSGEKTSVQTVSAGHQSLVVYDVTADDAGLYLCQVSRDGDLLKTEVTVVLCRR